MRRLSNQLETKRFLVPQSGWDVAAQHGCGALAVIRGRDRRHCSCLRRGTLVTPAKMFGTVETVSSSPPAA